MSRRTPFGVQTFPSVGGMNSAVNVFQEGVRLKTLDARFSLDASKGPAGQEESKFLVLKGLATAVDCGMR